MTNVVIITRRLLYDRLHCAVYPLPCCAPFAAFWDTNTQPYVSLGII